MADDEGSIIASSMSTTLVPFLYRVGTIVGALIAIAAVMLYVRQESLLYFPEIGGITRHNKDNPRGYRTPAYHNWPFEEHMIRCADGVNIHSWLLLGDKAASKTNSKPLPTIIFFHGNAGNIGLRLPNALQMAMQLERKVNILMVEYRGYGDSDDKMKPNEAGLKLDAQAALQFCLQHSNKIDRNAIFLFGRSLGGSVAFHLASYCQQKNIPLAGVIVENTFLSISSMVDSIMPKIIVLLKPLVLRMKWDSASIVPTLQDLPILYLAGSGDEIVPHSHMLKLYQLSQQASSNVKMHIVTDGTHNDTWSKGGQPYWNAIKNFVFSILNGTTEQGSSKTTAASATIGGEISSIPTMSTNLFGMAKDAMASNKAANTGGDDKDKKEL